MQEGFDYLIVGGGTAGCFLVSQLCSFGNVAVVEKGPVGPNLTQYSYNNGGNFPLGECLGGSSAVNASVFIYPTKSDLAKMDNYGWSKQQLFTSLEHLKKVIPLHYPEAITVDKSFSHQLLSSMTKKGIQFTNQLNVNSGEDEAIGATVKTLLPDKTRFSSYELIKDKNQKVTIFTSTLCKKIIFDDNKHAIGIKVEAKGCELNLYAKTIVICCGALESPKLLQFSGIGPERVLNAVGVPVIVENSQVGQNLNDHYQLRVKVNLPKVDTAATWSAILKSHPNVSEPDIIIQTWNNMQEKSFNMSIAHVKSNTRGRVELKSQNPTEKPSIVFDFLNNAEDKKIFVNALRKIGSLMDDENVDTKDLQNVLDQATKFNGDYYRSNNVGAYYTSWIHQWGTCKMGTLNSVVNTNFEVIGVKNLMVVDASVWPSSISVNPQSVVYLIASLAAQVLTGKN